MLSKKSNPSRYIIKNGSKSQKNTPVRVIAFFSSVIAIFDTVFFVFVFAFAVILIAAAFHAQMFFNCFNFL